jgi:hypothetical protein
MFGYEGEPVVLVSNVYMSTVWKPAKAETFRWSGDGSQLQLLQRR